MTTGTVIVTKSVRGEVIAEERRQITTWHCGGCGVLFGIDREYVEERRKDGKTFYCPNGCSRAYHETEADRLKARLASEQRALEATQDALNRERTSHAATKGQLTKAQKRAHAGICPHCHRTFQQVQRHIANKHAEPVEKDQGDD